MGRIVIDAFLGVFYEFDLYNVKTGSDDDCTHRPDRYGWISRCVRERERESESE